MALFSKQKQIAGTFMAATFVDWQKVKDVERLEKNLKKSIKKALKVSSVSINRLNSFLIISAEFTESPDVDSRKEAEQRVKDVLSKYAEKLNQEFRELVIYNGDSHIYYDAFRVHGLDLKDRMYNRVHDVVDDVEENISRIVSRASLTIWDFPGIEGDRIVLPNLVATIEDQYQDAPELPLILDELILANFAYNFVPFSKSLVSRLITGMEKLDSLVTEYQLGTLDVDTERAVRNFIGSISGLQEALKLLKRQFQRLSEVTDEIREELRYFTSAELNQWTTEIEELGIDVILSRINLLNDSIAQVKPKLRMKLKQSGESTVNYTDLFTEMVEIKALSNGLIQWVHRFDEIPSFTTLASGIAYEAVDGEEYEPLDKDLLIDVQKLFKLYNRGGSTVYALRGVDLQVEKGEFLIIEGPSGAGKTTLLNIMAGLDDANRGAVFFQGDNLMDMKDGKRTAIRRNHFSFIFQSYALVPHLTAFENAKLPIDMAGASKELVKGIQQLLDDIGIGPYSDHKPAYLSGGQMQRLGIARALVNQPDIIFADEPTGDLDEKTGEKIMELLKKYHEETGVTIVLVTHNPEVAKYGTRRIRVEDGQVVQQ